MYNNANFWRSASTKNYAFHHFPIWAIAHELFDTSLISTTKSHQLQWREKKDKITVVRWVQRKANKFLQGLYQLDILRLLNLILCKATIKKKKSIYIENEGSYPSKIWLIPKKNGSAIMKLDCSLKLNLKHQFNHEKY